MCACLFCFFFCGVFLLNWSVVELFFISPVFALTGLCCGGVFRGLLSLCYRIRIVVVELLFIPLVSALICLCCCGVVRSLLFIVLS